MSTNKTENYGLHAWETGDDFLRTEINENFAKLDRAAEIVTGSYTGNDQASQTIALGFTPRVVIVVNRHGGFHVPGDANTMAGGMAGAGSGSSTIEVTEGGFVVRKGGGYHSPNHQEGSPYFYLAFRN